MKVEELVKVLGGLPQDKEVTLFWDGESRGEIEGIYINKKVGVVLVGDWSIYERVIADWHKVVYSKNEGKDK